MPSTGRLSQGSSSEIAKVFSLKPGWRKERSALFPLGGSQRVAVEASAKSTVLSCPCFCLYVNIILGGLDLAQGPSEKVRFVLGHRLALVFRLRNCVRGDRSSLVTQPSSSPYLK